VNYTVNVKKIDAAVETDGLDVTRTTMATGSPPAATDDGAAAAGAGAANNNNEKQQEQATKQQQDVKGESSDEAGSSDNDSSAMGVSNGSVTGLRRGKCKWFNVAKGWGFITPNDGGQDVFVHQSVIQMMGFRSLGDDEEIEFECKVSDKGLEATMVQGVDGNTCRGSHRRPISKKKFRRLRCYNCGEFANHIASKCNVGPQPKKCHNCKGEDHLIADCPNRKASSRPKSAASSNADSSSTGNNGKNSSEEKQNSPSSPDSKNNNNTTANKPNGAAEVGEVVAAPTGDPAAPKQNEKAA
jgi:protein lin-28